MIKINTKEMRSVANFFTKMDKKGGRINIKKTNSSTNKTNKCKTPACIGGWLAVYYDTPTFDGKCRNYNAGADMFAIRLGFNDTQALRLWLGKNKKIWGHCAGGFLFLSERAWFESGEHGWGFGEKELTLSQVSYKLHKVADRIDEYQKQMK